MFKVPDLDKDKRCPACVSFAVALRRASWEAHPPHQIEQKAQRKKLLNSDSRCQELLTEAMDVILTRQAFVYFVPGTVPRTDMEESWKNGANDHILLYFNKTDAPPHAIGRFWSLQDLYFHRRLQVSDFQKIAVVLERNTDQSLMHFLHDELRETLGEETEALCYLDLFQQNGKTATTTKHKKEDYVSEPLGLPALRDFSRSGKAFDLNAEWLTLNILKNRTQDDIEALEWAYKLCKPKDLCGKEATEENANKKFLTNGLDKNNDKNNKKSMDKNQIVKEYIRSMFPVHPPKVEARDFSNDPEKASGVFERPKDRFRQSVDPEEMQKMYENYPSSSSESGANDGRTKTIRIEGKGGDEMPLMMDEEY